MRVLLVVQHPLLSDVLCEVLSDRGYDVAECDSTADASRLALEDCPEAVVLDLSVSVTEAEGLGRSILTAQPDTVLIGLGEIDAPDSMQRAFDLGCSAWVSPDAPLDQFLTLLEGVIKTPSTASPPQLEHEILSRPFRGTGPIAVGCALQAHRGTCR